MIGFFTHSVFHEEGDSNIVVVYSPEGLLEERVRQRDTLPVHEAIALAADACEKPS